ncbi:hypothetical protein EJ08DRAFT_703302 [Tothia fuscella]|uniref:Uncharacterized protein n=1 Tax=Tothia fuscella TaxID=1048955 RepID=A0A9P4NEZ5_9PEZI|nr:hypothetical protein EJ08DRAFT_703302 [Tothia fuscella]
MLMKVAGIYIHHILTSDFTKKQKNWVSNCGSPNAPALNVAGLLGGSAFVGAGEDSSDGGALYTSEDGTRETGYHIGATDSFTGWAEIVNYNKEKKQVYIYYDLEWIPGIHGNDVKMATLIATCGGSPAIKLSKTGPTNTTSGKFYFMEDGKVLGARGHLHDGGVKVALYLNDKFSCASDAVYGSKEGEGAVASAASIKTISGMTTCNGPFPVKKGDSLKLVAIYDLVKHPLRETGSGKAADVMGRMGVSFTANK